MSARHFRRAQWANVAGPALVASVLGCSSPNAPMSAGTTCPPAPTVCPTAMPGYAQDVVPIMQRDCIPCHAASTGGKDERSYDLAAAQKSAILFQVGDCLMPPSGSPQLTVAERNILLGSIECGAPND